jgi:hypothetical protein
MRLFCFNNVMQFRDLLACVTIFGDSYRRATGFFDDRRSLGLKQTEKKRDLADTQRAAVIGTMTDIFNTFLKGALS